MLAVIADASASTKAAGLSSSTGPASQTLSTSIEMIVENCVAEHESGSGEPTLAAFNNEHPVSRIHRRSSCRPAAAAASRWNMTTMELAWGAATAATASQLRPYPMMRTFAAPGDAILPSTNPRPPVSPQLPPHPGHTWPRLRPAALWKQMVRPSLQQPKDAAPGHPTRTPRSPMVQTTPRQTRPPRPASRSRLPATTTQGAAATRNVADAHPGVGPMRVVRTGSAHMCR